MAYIQLMINLIVFGAILWAVNVYIPMNATVRKVANPIVVVIAIPFVLGAFGFFGPISWCGCGEPMSTPCPSDERVVVFRQSAGCVICKR